MRKMLVTGGAGFIGSNFVLLTRRLHPEDKVFVLDKLTYAGNLENLKSLSDDKNCIFVKGDLNDFDLLDSLFEKEGIDTVVNFAAESHVDRSILGPKAFIETNVNGTFTLLEAARRNWKDFQNKKFLHVSTDEVYGSLGDTGFFTEETAYAPNSPYAASKASSDHLVRAYHHTYGLSVVTTNCSNNYGPYQFPEKLIPLMILNALKGKHLPVYGDGLNVRDWLFVEDHCKAIDIVLENGKLGETYNIGGNNEWKNIDIVNLICEILDEKIKSDKTLAEQYPFEGSRKKLIHFVKDRPGHDRRYAIDSGKVQRELGWRPEDKFETGIRKTIDWYINNRPWWERIISGQYMDYYEMQYKERLVK
ncbi:MAG: dTDP-glucose 4,6-dehydratase [Deltaproteobacteria bacterium]|nr:dTDP-glucose 4,6-dehydratase [Deltaproteobacteria bacterium]